MLVIGVALLVVYFAAQLHSLLFSRIALWQFDRESGHMVANLSAEEDGFPSEGPVDFGLWAKTRTKAYQMSLVFKLAPPIAILKIPKVHLTAPVFNDTDDITLNRGVGRIAGTAMPGRDGNLALAGHRDGFFRRLEDISVGDVIEIATREETDTYVVDTMEIVEPSDVSVLDSGPVDTVTLVTCYPFYFVGDAPERFIVKAMLTHRHLLQEARVSPPETNSTE
jgi:sortase A